MEDSMRGLSDVLKLAIVTGMVFGGSCSQTQTIQVRDPHEAVGNQGDAWEVVLGSPEAPPHAGWEEARLDESLAAGWSDVEVARPDLDDLRRIYLNPRPDQILYFRRRR
jgi:hypothetical protein